jgi:ATP-binding protein involved in chromosome partitioning
VSSIRAVHGMQSMYSVSIPPRVGCSPDNSPQVPIRDLTYAGGMPDPQSNANSRVSAVEHPLVPRIRTALHQVNDPEIRRPITDLGMVDGIEVDAAGQVGVRILLTVAGCPLRDTLNRDVTAAVLGVPGVSAVNVELGVMSDEQRVALRELLKGGHADREIPFARPDSLTQVIAVASGKGGVGKSSVTVNLAKALAAHGRNVGVLDADIYGHSVPAMLGVADSRPTAVEDMIMPVPADGLRVISIGMLKPRRDQVVAWRGPILDRALTQMLADVYWGDLDFLLIDLPPGTGDVAISLGQKLPNAEVLVVTTPQAAAAEVAERAGTMASMMNQRVIGVVENMSHLVTTCPHCGEVHTLHVFGTGGGAEVARTLSTRLGYPVALLAQIPLDPQLRASGDAGVPLVETGPDEPAALALSALADTFIKRGRGLLGKQLGLMPAGR